jgi:hypothetical protein
MSRSILEIYSEVKRATVAIVKAYPGKLPNRPFEIIGSGFCVHRSGVIVTCEHVWRAFIDSNDQHKVMERIKNNSDGSYNDIKAEKAYVLFYGGIKGPEIIMIQVPVVSAVIKTDYDLAILKISSHQAFSSGYPTVKIADYERIHEMMDVATCGYPLGEIMHDQMGTVTSTCTKGMISSIAPAAGVPKEHCRGFLLDITATNGNSGGPVFSVTSGRVFGVLQGGPTHPGTRQALPGIARAEPVYPLFEGDLMEKMIKGISTPKFSKN